MKRQTILLVESTDDKLKTNIALQLANRFRIPYFKNYAQRDIDFENSFVKIYGHTCILQFLEQTGYSVVLDSSYPKEYAQARASNLPVDYNNLAEIDRRFSKLNAHVLILAQNTYLLEDSKYPEFAAFSKCKSNLIMIENKSQGQIFEEALEFIK